MDDCCRGPTGCCREGYRCEPNYRTCVRVGVVPRPRGSTKVLIVPVVSRRNQGTTGLRSYIYWRLRGRRPILLGPPSLLPHIAVGGPTFPRASTTRRHAAPKAASASVLASVVAIVTSA
ncbi:hypothetical protein MTO96_018285 [Rhipicephalus appendiculatus]